MLISDKFWFLFLQAGMLLLFLFALYKDIRRNRHLIVGRGPKSRELFIVSASAIITIVVSVIFQFSNYPDDGKAIFYFIDLAIILYLCFYSSWFTNQLVSLKTRFEERKY